MRTDAHRIACEDVWKTYASASARVEALKGVTAAFPSGVTALVGPSGSGKSSLLRIVAGLDKPTAGRVLVDGRDITALAEPRLLALRRRIVGYVFQRPADNLIPHLTVAEHIRLARRLGGLPGDVDPALLDKLGIGHRRDFRPVALSGGEQQRAAFAFALAAGPRVILADEPTAELDRGSVRGLIDLVRDLAEGGVTFVIATHDPEVVAIAIHLLELDHGVATSAASVRPHRAPAASGRSPGTSRSEPVLTVTGIGKAYAAGSEVVHALRRVSFRLHPGELVAIVGPSGSGKTTLLNILAGWEWPDEGKVSLAYGPREAADAPWDVLAVLPQKFGLLDELTVEENISYPGRLAGTLEVMRGRVPGLADGLGLTETLARPPGATSVGQQQRTALARALVVEPKIILADEPTGHQDAGSAERIVQALREAVARGTCCVVATHNLELAAECDRVLEMDAGELRPGS